MASFAISFTSSAEKEFKALPREIQERFASAFEHLVKDPKRRRPKCDIRRLSHVANAWRLRVGEYRGIYAIEGEEIVFTRFGHRRSVYGRR
ncbi:MAG: type II toxin-antitoxin system RelE/ParE family toxin [Thermoplasmata archaeon]